jgi:DNA-binding XRE family transcriptional regulator
LSDSVESAESCTYIHCWGRYNNRTGNHVGHFLYDFRPVFGQFLGGPFPAYAFSKPLDQIDFDPAYPKNPSTLGDYIRKYRKDKGISQVELSEKLGVNEMTIVNWEIRGMVPRIRSVREKLIRSVEGVERWLGA